MISFNKICERFPDVENIIFLSESDEDPSRKTYLLNDTVIKSRKLDDDITTHLRHNDLEEEYEILKSSAAVNGTPKALHYNKNELYELLFLSYLPGEQLRNKQLTFIQTVRVTFQVLKILIRLSGKGICHNDVTPQNVLITGKNTASLVDFDQAVRTTIVKAFAGNILGIKSGESKVSYGLYTIFKDYLRKHFPNFLYSTGVH